MSRRHHAFAGKRWQAVRRFVFDRDRWRCTACGRAGRLEAHHEPPLCRAPRDPFDPAGIVTVCRSCHIAETAKGNRKPESPALADWKRVVAREMERGV